MAKAPVYQLAGRVLLPGTGPSKVVGEDVRYLIEAGIPLKDGNLDEARYDYANLLTPQGREISWKRKKRGAA